MKAHSTRIPPNYVLIGIVAASTIFWLGIIKVLFGHEIKVWLMSIASAIL